MDALLAILATFYAVEAETAGPAQAICRFAAERLAGAPACERIVQPPRVVPGTAWFAAGLSASDVPGILKPVAAGFASLASCAHWRQNPNYTVATIGQHFIDGYGYIEVLGPEGPVVDPEVRVGVLLLGPHRLYPRHHHPAEEVYHPLSGQAWWWRADGSWTAKAAGAAIHHPSMLPHATRAGAAPLLALYVWRGAVAEAARLSR
jgi:quercetin dioxygenase-like cupin family protein